MPVVRHAYVKPEFMGSPRQQILGRMQEIVVIWLSRDLLQTDRARALADLNTELEVVFGIDVGLGVGPDEGWLMGRDTQEPHVAQCTSEICYCPGLVRVQLCPSST